MSVTGRGSGSGSGGLNSATPGGGGVRNALGLACGWCTGWARSVPGVGWSVGRDAAVRQGCGKGSVTVATVRMVQKAQVAATARAAQVNGCGGGWGGARSVTHSRAWEAGGAVSGVVSGAATTQSTRHLLPYTPFQARRGMTSTTPSKCRACTHPQCVPLRRPGSSSGTGCLRDLRKHDLDAGAQRGPRTSNGAAPPTFPLRGERVRY